MNKRQKEIKKQIAVLDDAIRLCQRLIVVLAEEFAAFEMELAGKKNEASSRKRRIRGFIRK